MKNVCELCGKHTLASVGNTRVYVCQGACFLLFQESYGLLYSTIRLPGLDHYDSRIDSAMIVAKEAWRVRHGQS